MNAPFKIVFENESWIVVEKPAQYLSVPSRMGRDDSRPVVGLLLQDHLGQQIFPVHRLDFEVSGLLIFAKNEKAHRFGNQIFETSQVQKTYRALSLVSPEAHFNFGKPHQEWVSKILKGKKRSYESPVGKNSVTQVFFLETRKILDREFWVWNLNPITGRSHQLRFEMYKHKMPILGDSLYGSDFKTPLQTGIGLRAFELKLSSINSIHSLGLPQILQIEPELKWVSE